MSSQKKTAFARTPRNKSNGGAQPATFTINKQFLDRMTQARMPPDVSTVLTKSSAELSISVQPNGKGTFAISSQGQTIGDSGDLQKVQTLGTFINDERKAIVKTSVSAMAKKTIAAVVLCSREPVYEEEVPRPIVRIDKQYVDVFRSINAQADMLNANLQQITQVEATGRVNEMVKSHLVETGARIRECLGSYLFYRGGIADGEEVRKLNDFLFDKRVLGWVFSRLCSQKLQLGGKDFEYRRLYYPKDPTKGLTITLKEIRDQNLAGNQGGILAGMGPYFGLFGSATVRRLCGIPDEWDLNGFTDMAKPLANVPIPVVPPPGAVSSEEHFSILNQHGDRGLPWSVGNTTTPQDTMKFVGTVPKRVAYGFIGRARFSAPWYATLFPGFAFDSSVAERDNRSVFSQLLTQFRAGTIEHGFFLYAKGGGITDAQRGVIYPLILAIMDVPPHSEFSEVLRDAILTHHRVIPNGETSGTKDIWSAIMTRRVMDETLCQTTLSGVLEANLDPKSGTDRHKGDIRMARSPLSEQGSQLVREFKRRGYSALAVRVDQWLRSFLTARLQGAVAEVIAARLEASLATPIQFGRGDTQVFLEPAEFAADDDAVDDNDSEAETEPQGDNPDDR